MNQGSRERGQQLSLCLQFRPTRVCWIQHASSGRSPSWLFRRSLATHAGGQLINRVITIMPLLGAWLIQRPHWAVTGAIFGLLSSFVALIGDLVPSSKILEHSSPVTVGCLIDLIRTYRSSGLFVLYVSFAFCKEDQDRESSSRYRCVSIYCR